MTIGRQHGLEALVDEGEDRGAGAEIGRYRQEAVGILSAKGVARLHIGADIGAAEAIDRLLGIADQEERPGRIRNRVQSAIAIGRFAAQPPKDLGLQRIGILELIDEDMGEALAQRAPDIVMVAQQIARGEDQIVEVELGARALMVAIAMQDRTRFLDQRRQNLGPQAQRGVTMPHQAIHNAVHHPNQERMAVPLAKLEISPMKIAWRCWRYAGYAYVQLSTISHIMARPQGVGGLLRMRRLL